MAWTAPTPRTTGELITASIWNTDIVANLNLLKTSINNSGALDAYGGTLRRPAIYNYIEGFAYPAISGGVCTIDLTYGEHLLILNANVTSFIFANSPWVSGTVTTCTLALYGDGNVRTISWTGSGITFRFTGAAGAGGVNGFVPSCTPAGVYDVVTMRTYDGVSWFAAVFGMKM